MTGWLIGSVLPIAGALLLAHFAQRTDDAMDYDGGRPNPPTPEEVNAQQLNVGFVASYLAGRS